MTVKTRFAPSPTGYLHIGGARTALFSWLYARRHCGTFVLRIEDTDLERSTPESVQAILDGMEWLGLHHDEGPYYQTQRFDRYREVADRLLDEGKAYRCWCSKERLEKLREDQMAQKLKPRYDGRCKGLSAPPPGAGDPVIRFRNPESGQVVVDDQVRGRVVFENDELDDLIIFRSDGSPTYNFSVVVDDMDMGITHVIRGDDHLNNTPRQMNILNALGYPPPVYAHVPMILGDDGKRLSKRHGAVSVMQYRDEGYLPQAVLNYLVRLGWSHGDQEIFTTDEMARLFDMKDINQSASSLNPGKLTWLNQHYLKTLPEDLMARHLRFHFERLGIDPAAGPDLTALVRVQRERTKTLVEMAEVSRMFYEDFADYDPKAAQKNLTPAAAGALLALEQALGVVAEWVAPQLHAAVESVAAKLEVKIGQVAQPLRVALSGSGVSPAIDVTLELMGPQRTLERIRRALRHIGNQPA